MIIKYVFGCCGAHCGMVEESLKNGAKQKQSNQKCVQVECTTSRYPENKWNKLKGEIDNGNCSRLTLSWHTHSRPLHTIGYRYSKSEQHGWRSRKTKLTLSHRQLTTCVSGRVRLMKNLDMFGLKVQCRTRVDGRVDRRADGQRERLSFFMARKVQNVVNRHEI